MKRKNAKTEKFRKRIFKKSVFEVVKNIPKGKVLSYKRVAQLAGFPRAWRAVGNILNKNRDSKVPCHRVIRSNGEIGGYNRGTKRKLALLKKEGVLFKRSSLKNK